MTYPERIEAWVKTQFATKHVARVTDELIDAASEGPVTSFQERALQEIFG